MKLFLDSSAVIELFKSNQKVVELINEADEVYTSSLCAYEVLLGEKYLENKGRRSQYTEVCVFFETAATIPFEYSDAKSASEIMAALSSKGKKIPEMDALITAQALASGATIVTRDSRHFKALEEETGLSVASV